MPKTSYSEQLFTIESYPAMRFRVLAHDRPEALRRARRLLEARHGEDCLTDMDIEFGDGYLDLLIDGHAPLAIVAVEEPGEEQ